MKILILIDGTNGVVAVNDVRFEIEKTIKRTLNDAETEYVAEDKENGTKSEFFTNMLGGKTLGGKVYDGNFFVKNAAYGVCGDTAIISVADTSSVKEVMIKDPGYATSYGLGQQIKSAFKVGKEKFVLMIDGGASNDGGAGAAAALGVKFYDKEGNEFVPTGVTIGKVEKIDESGLDERIKTSKFVAISEENVKITGEKGCAFTTAKGKGAKNEKMQVELEENMKEFLKKNAFDNIDKEENGLGNGGGLGLFTKTILKGVIKNKVQWIRENAGGYVEKKLENVDGILSVKITGEGRKNDEFDALTEIYKEKAKRQFFFEAEIDGKEESEIIKEINVKITEICDEILKLNGDGRIS
mgnify:CR=1 FL=1